MKPGAIQFADLSPARHAIDATQRVSHRLQKNDWSSSTAPSVKQRPVASADRHPLGNRAAERAVGRVK